MDQQDNLDQILTQLKAALDGAKSAGGGEDLVIIDKKQFEILLKKLTDKVMELTDFYDDIDSSRIRDELDRKKKAEAMMDEARTNAEDIYASSILYTADSLAKISALMDDTNKAVNDLFLQFKRDLRSQKDQVKKNSSQLQSHLADLKDAEKYLRMLRRIEEQRPAEEKGSSDGGSAAPEDAGPATDDSPEVYYDPGSAYIPSSNAQVKINEAYFERNGLAMPGDEAIQTSAPIYEKADIQVNTDSAYFKWKEEQKRGQLNAEYDAEAKSPDEIIYEPSDKEESAEGSAKTILKNIIFGKQ